MLTIRMMKPIAMLTTRMLKVIAMLTIRRMKPMHISPFSSAVSAFLGRVSDKTSCSRARRK